MFTYNLAIDPADELFRISRVRQEIGDTVMDAGVKPDGSNFSDDEIAVWLDEEGDDVMKATARACETLSRLYTLSSKRIEVGPRKEEYENRAAEWSQRSAELRGQFDRRAVAVRIIRD